MQILVGVKWVALRPEVDPLSGVVSEDARFSGLSEADRSALEWALRLLEERGPGSVAVATVGPPEAEVALREALAVGAERAVRVVGLPATAPSWVVAAELAAVARDIGCDLALFGYASLDRGSGSVPAFAAHQLGWAQALGLVTVEPGERDGPLVVQRRLDGGRRERLALPSPAVVSVEPGPELRRASLAATLAATTAVVEERAAVSTGSEADLTVTARRPFRPPPRIVPAPQGSTRQRLDALLGAGGPSKSSAQTHDVSPEEAARLTVEHLLTWGYLDPERVTLGGNAKGC